MPNARHRRAVVRIGLTLIALLGAVVVSLAIATSAPATAAAHSETVSQPAPTRGPQEVEGPVGDLPDGSFPPGINVIAKLPEMSTADSNTYVTSTGSRVLMTYAGPVNYEDSSGDYVPIDDTATASSGGGWDNAAGWYQANVPASLPSPVSVTSGSNTLSFNLTGGESGGSDPVSLTPTSSNGSATATSVSYSDPLPSTDITYTFGNTGVDESLSLSSADAPTSYTWSLSPSSGMTASMNPGGDVSFTDASGTEVMRITAPTIEDANHLVGPAPTMSLSPDGTTLTLSLAPDASWLADSSRAFPVTVDPSVTVSIPETGQECQLFQSVPGTSYCGSTTSYDIGDNGYTDNAHSIFSFPDLASSVPYDSLVQNAVFGLYEQGAIAGNSETVTLQSITNQAWSSSQATWNSAATGTAWANPGAYSAAYPGTTTTGTTSVAAGTANGWLTWSPVQQVQAWVNGIDPTNPTCIPTGIGAYSGCATSNQGALINNEGFMASSDGATNTIEVTNWQSSSTSQWPYLSVQYTPRIGTASNLSILKTAINDKTTLGVNPANGDLSVDTSLFNLNGIGLPLQVDQDYDSEGAVQTSMGDSTSTGSAGWALSPSFDQPQVIVKASYPGVLQLVSSSGTNAVFTNGNLFGQFTTSPPGLNAQAAATSSTTVAITFNQSQQVWNFSQIAGSSTDYHLSNIQDRNGNTITYNYNTPGTELTSITGTEGQSLTIGYNSSNLVSSITDETGREITFTYNCSCAGTERLTKATYGGKTTHYAYDSNGNLNEITDPAGNITTMAYNSSQQVTSVTRVTDDSMLTGDTTYYSYAPGSASSPLSGVTTVTDPDSNATTYAYDAWDRVTQVTDALGHSENSNYNAQSSTTQLQNALSQATTLAYDNNNNLDEITAPQTSSGQTPATTYYNFNTPTTGSGAVTGGTYLPSSEMDPQTNCASFFYDSDGNQTASYQGFAPGTSCDGMTSGTGVNSVTNAYAGDGSTSCGGYSGEKGQLCSTTSGNLNVTSYAYNSLGQLTSITQPGGSCTGTRTLCTTITYDSLGRVSTVTDGKNQTDTYSYDDWDRITQILYNGTTTCHTSAGTCIKFTYDGDGNVTKRIDSTGTTTFTYDTLNRLTLEELPGSLDACSGFAGISYTYDAASNLVDYCDTGGTVSYVYDAANRNTGEATDGGSCAPGHVIQPCTTYSYNTANEMTLITYPSSTGVTDTLGYDDADHQTSELVKNSTTTLENLSYTYFKPSSTTTDQALQQTAVNGLTGLSTTYSYDSQDRLSGAAETGTGATNYSYAYDGDSNLTQRTVGGSTTSYGYSASDALCWVYSGTSSNSCTSPPTGATTYSSDADGNQTGSSAGESISYNSLNQTTTLTPAGGSALSMAYTGTDSTQRTSAGATTFANALFGVAEQTTSGTITYFAYQPDGRLSSILVGSTRYYVYYNGAGSIGGMFESCGCSAAVYTYDPYGTTTATGSEASANPFRFKGGYEDSTNYYKFGTRYYNPSLAAWTQQDPNTGSIQDPGTVNRYPYAGADPVNEVDPTGTSILGDIANAVVSGYDTVNNAVNAAADYVFGNDCAASYGLTGLLLGIALAAAPITAGASLAIGAAAAVALTTLETQTC